MGGDSNLSVEATGSVGDKSVTGEGRRELDDNSVTGERSVDVTGERRF